ncbi:MutS-related protein, family 1 [Clostridiaceae bacterium JG1575]|nr:MutS-related protein, family 1 [Clostridiaceae bacterium JG1575]
MNKYSFFNRAVRIWPQHPHDYQHHDRNAEFLKEFGQKGSRYLDDITVNDLGLEKVYAEIDRTYTAPGSNVLWNILRDPLTDELDLEQRSRHIEAFRKNRDLRERAQGILCTCGYEVLSDYRLPLLSQYSISPKSIALMSLLGLLLTAAILYSIATRSIENALYTVLPLLLINGLYGGIVERREDQAELRKIKGLRTKGGIAFHMASLMNLMGVLQAGVAIAKDPELSDVSLGVREHLSAARPLHDSFRIFSWLERINFLDYLAQLFLLKHILYYKTQAKLQKDNGKLRQFVWAVGYLDALVSVAAYQDHLAEEGQIFCAPKFIQGDASLSIKDGVHPLVDGCVPNSIELHREGLILTGSNMSGKSTFMRVLGINACLAQTLCLARCRKYEGSLFRILSSIDPEDDTISGKSYFMAEAQAVLRIVKVLEDGVPTLCILDEMFRGTNPLERISASVAILDFIQRQNCILVLATHDRDIIGLVKNPFQLGYFTETVDSDGLTFDYRLRSGINETSNAIRILDVIGYPKSITDQAKALIRSDQTLVDYTFQKPHTH